MPLMNHEKKRVGLTVEQHVSGVLSGDRSLLARTITLIESNASEHFEKARQVLKALLPHSGKSLRIGISGIPGSGKSTLIETLGCFLIERDFKVAVLTVDPTSAVTKGSILGDKTRMEKLARQDNAFIRPSPSGDTMGGVARTSRETILVCEAAGYNIILVETVGVGQNEITVRSMVDFFLLLMIAGARDELQGKKRGIVEIADALLINKADGENLPAALKAQNDYGLALKYLAPATPGWKTEVHTCSALTGEGIDEIWARITEFEKTTRKTGVFDQRRKKQSLDWVFGMVEYFLRDHFFNHPVIQKKLPAIKKDILNGSVLPTTAAEQLLNLFFSKTP